MGLWAQRRAAAKEGLAPERAKGLAQAIGGGDDHGPQLAQGTAADVDGSLAGEHQHPQHLTGPVGARHGRVGAREGGSGRPHGIQGIGLGAPA